ncbi:MAG TPA: glycosyltransferase family 9 protein [Gemmatirosa sp.]|nr:glycosyltransferase family 9 protein [Gemmatirosa sp.]
MREGDVLALPARPRILVVMLAAVGDAVHAMSTLTFLRRARPDAHVSWVLQPGLAPFVRGHPAVDEVLEFDRKLGRRGFAAIRTRLAGERYDAVLVLQPYLKAGIVAAFARAPHRLGFDRRRARDASWLFANRHLPARPLAHTQDMYLEFLDALGVPHGVPEAASDWQVGPWPEERARQAAFLARLQRPMAAIVVGTTKAEKDWLPERWAQVCDALAADYGLQPVLCGGRSDRELAAEAVILREVRHARPLSALGSGLRPLVGILDSAALVLSPDTGPLHVSVALGRPVVSLMGYTNPKRVGPYRRFQDLLVDAYGDPGEEYPPSMAHRDGRMARIAVTDVLERVERWRTTYAGGAS